MVKHLQGKLEAASLSLEQSEARNFDLQQRVKSEAAVKADLQKSLDEVYSKAFDDKAESIKNEAALHKRIAELSLQVNNLRGDIADQEAEKVREKKELAQLMLVMKNDLDQKQAKIWQQQEIPEDSEKNHLVDLASQLQYQTERVKDLQKEVDQLYTQLAFLNIKSMQSKAQAEMTSADLQGAWKREVGKVSYLENQVEVLREAIVKLSSYPEALLRCSRDELLKAMGEMIISARKENAILSVSLRLVTAERDQAINDSNLWEPRCRELRDAFTKKIEELSEQESRIRKQDIEIARLETVLDMRTDAHDRLIADKDLEIRLQEENRRLLRERLSQIGRLNANDQVTWYLDFKDEELQDVKDRLDASLAKIGEYEYYLGTLQGIHDQDVELEHLNDYHAQETQRALRMTEEERNGLKDQLQHAQKVGAQLEAQLRHAEEEGDRLKAQVARLQEAALSKSQSEQTEREIFAAEDSDHEDDESIITVKAIEEGRLALSTNFEDSPISSQQQDEASIEADRRFAEELQATLYMSHLEQPRMELPAAEDSDNEDEETVRAFNATEEDQPAPNANSENNLAGWEP